MSQETARIQERTTTLFVTPEFELQQMAERAQCFAAYQRLHHLCLQSRDVKFIGAMVALISGRECLSIISQWATESHHADQLERLARACELEADLINRLRPFKSDQRVEDRFKNSLQEHYLASMAAARRAYPPDETAAWLQRLRIFILLRAMAALEAGAAREQHIWDVCTVVRDVCENELSVKGPWIQAIRGSANGLFEFSSEMILNCRRELSKVESSKGQSAFYNSLIRLAEQSSWTALPIKQPQTDPNLKPYLSQARTENWKEFFRLLDDGDNNLASRSPSGDIYAVGITAQPTDVDQSQSKRIRLGTGLRLEGIERNLFLRHSWHHLTKQEEKNLSSRIASVLDHGSAADKLGCSIATLAILSSQSMHDVRKLQLSTVSEDWSLDLAAGRLVRKPPRFGRRWRSASANGSTDGWIQPLAQTWEYRLDPKVLAPLRAAIKSTPSARNIDELWTQSCPDTSLANWFDTQLANTKELARLSSPCTANLAAMVVFGRIQDQSLARLICSDTRTALPAACAYGSIRAPKVSHALEGAGLTGLATFAIPYGNPELNACGSELDILLPRLQSSISELVGKVEAAANANSWVEHHNLLTALTVVSLLASTGARPVNSPFETLAWFDFTRRLLFVEDKMAGPTQGSRLCVLSEHSNSLLQEHYIPHLDRLAKAASASAPRFASAIESVLRGATESPLPLFFFIRSEPTFDWMEVSETQLTSVCRLNWPLPWNLFRHMTSTLLVDWGLHPDIRDALLGHADHDAESHGEFSTRTPIVDLEQARPLVNRLQSEIGFRLPTEKQTPAISCPSDMDKSVALLPRAFGRKVRANRRSETLTLARQVARKDIESELNKRTVDQLTSEELDQIARKMLARPDGMPHIQGSLRYAVFEEFLNEAWRAHGHHAKVKRRYLISLQGRQMFNESVIFAEGQLAKVAIAFEEFLSALRPSSERPVLAAYLAAIDIIVNSRVACHPLICALLCNNNSIQLVRFQKRYWLEWAFNSTWCDGKPAFRVEVSERAARWINMAQSGKSYREVPPIPFALGPIALAADIPESQLGQFFTKLTHLQSQINCLELPGWNATYLNGSRQSSALPHTDWIRAMTQAQPTSQELDDPGHQGLDADEEEAAAVHFFRSHHQPPKTVEGTALKRCADLFKKIGAFLTGEDSNPKITAKIASAVKESGFSKGDAPFLLTHFVTHLLKRKPKRGKRDRLRSKTALRYWHSLSGPFLEAASDANLLGMEEEELTDLYREIVDTWNAGKSDEDGGVEVSIGTSRSDLSQSHPDSDREISDAARRTAAQLKEFHDFACVTYGLVDPDWSEVCDGESIGVGRPGLILLKEYLAILNLILDGKPVDSLDDESLSRAFVLVVCCRFGLRIGEAVGLHRCDWTGLPNARVVLVQNNSTRSLKTTRSRRTVPLVETLGDIESAIVDAILVRWTHRNGEDENAPLLPNIDHASFERKRNKIADRLLQTIKSVTGNSGSTVHAFRHAYAMRVLSILLNLPLDCDLALTEEFVRDVRMLILGRASCDRRALWAVARLLGHANPAMTIQSYVNCLFAWLKNIQSQTAGAIFFQSDRMIDLDLVPLDHDYLQQHVTSSGVSKAPVEPLLLRSLRFLRLIVVGQTIETAARNSDIDASASNAIAAVMNRASLKLQASDSRYSGFKLLSGISVARMTELVRIATVGNYDSQTLYVFDGWESTIGASRQILLFEAKHIEWFARFSFQLSLTIEDVWLVEPNSKSNSFKEAVSSAGLADYLHSKQQVSKSFQLDVARFGEPTLIAPHRISAIIRDSGQLKSSHELLLLWVVWIFARGQDNESCPSKA